MKIVLCGNCDYISESKGCSFPPVYCPLARMYMPGCCFGDPMPDGFLVDCRYCDYRGADGSCIDGYANDLRDILENN